MSLNHQEEVCRIESARDVTETWAVMSFLMVVVICFCLSFISSNFEESFKNVERVEYSDSGELKTIYFEIEK